MTPRSIYLSPSVARRSYPPHPSPTTPHPPTPPSPTFPPHTPPHTSPHLPTRTPSQPLPRRLSRRLSRPLPCHIPIPSPSQPTKTPKLTGSLLLDRCCCGTFIGTFTPKRSSQADGPFVVRRGFAAGKACFTPFYSGFPTPLVFVSPLAPGGIECTFRLSTACAVAPRVKHTYFFWRVRHRKRTPTKANQGNR